MTSNATCDSNSASWINNSQGEDPCRVYARLQGQCISEFVLKPLSATLSIYEPTNNACGCNVVAYNLMAACTWCQSSTTLHNWWGVSYWTEECRDVTYNPSELPASISFDRSSIPSWALAVPTRFTWLPYEASAIATPGGPTSRSADTLPNTSTPSSTTILSASSASSNSVFSASVTRTGTAPAFSSSVGSTDNNASNVAGAALISWAVWVVILIFLVLASTGLCIGLGGFYLKRRQRKKWAVPTAEYCRRQEQGYSGGYDQYPPSIYPNAEGSVVALTYVYENPGFTYLADSAPSPMTTREDFHPPAYQDEASTPGTEYYGDYGTSGPYVGHSEQVAWGANPVASTPSVNGGRKMLYAASSEGPHTSTSAEKRGATRLQTDGSGDKKVVYR